MWISDKLDSTFATDSRLVRGSSVKYVPRKGQYFRNELGALNSKKTKEKMNRESCSGVSKRRQLMSSCRYILIGVNVAYSGI